MWELSTWHDSQFGVRGSVDFVNATSSVPAVVVLKLGDGRVLLCMYIMSSSVCIYITD